MLIILIILYARSAVGAWFNDNRNGNVLHCTLYKTGTNTIKFCLLPILVDLANIEDTGSGKIRFITILNEVT